VTAAILTAGLVVVPAAIGARDPQHARGHGHAVSRTGPGAVASTLADGSQLDGLGKAAFVPESISALAAARAASARPHVPAVKPAAPRRPPAAAVPAPAPAPSAPPAPVYLNPLRSVSGLVPERIDMGVDFGGAGPVYALGNAVITTATGASAGWPGGGWITYRLTGGPAAGLSVYVAEDVTPAVQVGQVVSSSAVIANMYNGGDGIETGWAMPDGASAESQLPVAGGISGAGPFPTRVGLSFDVLLQGLGVPAAANFGQLPYGLLPAGYPAD
jgi:hypothetical protein